MEVEIELMNAEQAHKLPHLKFDGGPFSMLIVKEFTTPIVPPRREQDVDHIAPFPCVLFWDTDDRAFSRGGQV